MFLNVSHSYFSLNPDQREGIRPPLFDLGTEGPDSERRAYCCSWCSADLKGATTGPGELSVCELYLIPTRRAVCVGPLATAAVDSKFHHHPRTSDCHGHGCTCLCRHKAQRFVGQAKYYITDRKQTKTINDRKKKKKTGTKDISL